MPPLVIAHRGDSAHRPENTLSAFASALELGVELVEMDVQLSRDGAVVVIHDASVDRTTDGTGRVSDLTLGELRKLSAGYPLRYGKDYAGERIPTFDEAIEAIGDRATLQVEIKGATEGVAEARTTGKPPRWARTTAMSRAL